MSTTENYSLSLHDALPIYFNGVFNSTKAALPFLRKSKPSKILNISSVAAEFPIPFQAFYSSTKAAVTRSEEHTSELQSRPHIVCRLLLEKKKEHKKLIDVL